MFRHPFENLVERVVVAVIAQGSEYTFLQLNSYMHFFSPYMKLKRGNNRDWSAVTEVNLYSAQEMSKSDTYSRQSTVEYTQLGHNSYGI